MSLGDGSSLPPRKSSLDPSTLILQNAPNATASPPTLAYDDCYPSVKKFNELFQELRRLQNEEGTIFQTYISSVDTDSSLGYLSKVLDQRKICWQNVYDRVTAQSKAWEEYAQSRFSAGRAYSKKWFGIKEQMSLLYSSHERQVGLMKAFVQGKIRIDSVLSNRNPVHNTQIIVSNRSTQAGRRFSNLPLGPSPLKALPPIPQESAASGDAADSDSALHFKDAYNEFLEMSGKLSQERRKRGRINANASTGGSPSKTLPPLPQESVASDNAIDSSNAQVLQDACEALEQMCEAAKRRIAEYHEKQDNKLQEWLKQRLAEKLEENRTPTENWLIIVINFNDNWRSIHEMVKQEVQSWENQPQEDDGSLEYAFRQNWYFLLMYMNQCGDIFGSKTDAPQMAESFPLPTKKPPSPQRKILRSMTSRLLLQKSANSSNPDASP